MSKVFHLFTAMLASLLFLCGPAVANDYADYALTDDPSLADDPSAISGFFIGPQVGTLGVGLNLGYQFNDYFKVRLNANHLPLSISQTIDDIDFRAKYKSTTFGALADVHPFSGHFRLTGGVYYMDMSVDVTAKLAGGSYKIGDTTYDGSKLGSGKGTVEWERNFAPYLGLGYGSGAGDEPGFSFHMDAGVLFYGDPTVKVDFTSADSTVRDQLKQDIPKYERKAENDIKDTLPVWPVLSLGFIYRF